MSSLIPKLREIKVRADQLFLDPNNPRLISQKRDRRPPSTAVTHAAETRQRMESRYKVDELKKSIRENGWIPVDYIFVKQIPGEAKGRYLVLEGNRRVTALRGLLDETELTEELRESLKEISVMEVIDDLPDDELNKKISYLLGVRHHGALVKWSPFAQAKNIYSRYQEVLGAETFLWKEEVAGHVANALSIPVDEVRKRLQVYVAMQQLSLHPVVAQAKASNARAGMQDHYYSVVAEIANNASRYGKHFPVNPESYQFEEATASRMINLCHFDKPNRDGAPINNPQQWRKLEQILADPDPEKRRINLARVEVNKEKPSDVWAERASELRQLQWDQWLQKVDSVLRKVTIDDIDSAGAGNVVARLNTLVAQLSALNTPAAE
jgi:hypothetical protein